MMRSSGKHRFAFWLVIVVAVMSVAVLLTQSGPVATRPVFAAAASLPDASADRVLGQVNYTSSDVGVLNKPVGVAVASDGRLFVVEFDDNEVSSWPDAATSASGSAPDRVIGQYGETPSATTLYLPESIAVDSSDNLWVSDTFHHRVLRIPPPYTGGADLVLGQPDFVSGESNRGGSGPAANSFNFPRGLAFDASGNLYVADIYNNRVVRFAPPFSDGQDAVEVFGQPSFFDNTARTTNDGLYVPTAVVAHPDGYIFIADRNNNRVLRWTPGEGTANLVLGQPDFETTPPFYSGSLPPDYSTAADCVQNPFASPIPPLPDPSDTNLSLPLDLAIDGAGDLLVSDTCWHRILVYFSDNFSDATADRVYGQPDFTSGALQAPNRTSFHTPLGLHFLNGSIFVADHINNGVLAFDPSSSPGDTATPTNTPTNTPINAPTSTPTATASEVRPLLLCRERKTESNSFFFMVCSPPLPWEHPASAAKS